MELGEAESKPILQGDDPELSVISFDEICLPEFSNDEELAEELQLQEVLVSCTETGQHSSSRPCCEICGRPMASTEDAQKAKCSHVICPTCLRLYIDSELKKNITAVECPNSSCDAVLEPELYQKILPPEVFDEWISARQGERRGKETRIRITHHEGGDQKSMISIEQLIKTDHGKDFSFHTTIQGEYDRDALLKLVNKLLAALDVSAEDPDDPEVKQLIQVFREDPDDPNGKQLIKCPCPMTELGQSSSGQLIEVSEEHPDDPKGKQLIKFPYSKTELGQSSSGQLIQVSEEHPDDPEGKQLIEFRYSKTELGQSCSSSLIEEELYCSICMEAKPLSKSFSITSCPHKFCTSCVGQYITAKVEENLTAIGCPDPECKDGILEPETCRLIIPIEVFDRWGIALCESLLGSRKFYCPYKDCSALLVDEGGDEEGGVITDSECPHCNRVFCAQCRVPWHDGIGCKEFQQLGEDERGREDLMLRQLATDSKWQRCPQCRIFVERIDGCKFMNCRCGYCFCYVCASPMSKDNHFCEKCMN